MNPDPYEHFIKRRAQTLDTGRADAIEARHLRGGRSARQNLADLLDGGEFIEYGQFAVAAQRSRRTQEELQQQTAADGVLTVVGEVNGTLFPAHQTATALIINDYTVLAGTQGYFHHRKIDRMLALAKQRNLPVIMFTEGGGGRPGDTDVMVMMGGLNLPTFHAWAALSGLVPRVAVNHGYCFAGNAALFGGADVRIATRNSHIGMAGPAMIEGAGLGTYAPDDIGPVDVHLRTGVVDLLVDDEAEGVQVARQLLGYWQGPLRDWTAPDQRVLRSVLPGNRRMAYEVRTVLHAVLDTHSFLEIRADFGRSVVTAFARIEGLPVAVIANDCRHRAGAIDVDAAVKLADFYTLAETWGLPVIAFVDTPGFMVGPESEAAGAPGVMARLFRAAASLSSPIVAIFLRRAYGLGAMAMVGGSLDIPVYAASWPQGEFGPMGLEGAVQLGFKAELEALPEGPERQRLFDRLLEQLYQKGQATETASFLEIDAVIDPIDTRCVVVSAMTAFAATR